MLSVLALCGIGGLLCVTLLFASPYASINLHRTLLHAVFAAPYSWLVATDSGVTLNRQVGYFKFGQNLITFFRIQSRHELNRHGALD